jgi:hypothetical protein
MGRTATKREAAAERSLTVRISGAAHRTLKNLAAQSGEPLQMVLDRAIEAYRRQRFFEEANAAYAALRSDPDAWQEELAERAAWDATLRDDLDEE